MAAVRIKSFMHALPVVLFLCLPNTWCKGQEYENIYCKMAPEKYLTGRFTPGKMTCFVNLSKAKIPATRKNMYLRREAAASLKKMLAAFKRDNPDIKLRVRSATRNFYDQRSIWGGKWQGKRLVVGKDLSKTIKDPTQRALKILEYSSMPGTSRHHWGTDVDFNSLTNSYFEKGEGKIIYTWLKVNGARYGYGQPYTAGRSDGYNEEKWHWSYLPLAKKMLKDWNNLIRRKDPGALKISFPGRNAAWRFAPVYVNAIAEECR